MMKNENESTSMENRIQRAFTTNSGDEEDNILRNVIVILVIACSILLFACQIQSVDNDLSKVLVLSKKSQQFILNILVSIVTSLVATMIWVFFIGKEKRNNKIKRKIRTLS
jgi:uncharacterized membrane protein (DUF106 family)